MLTPSSSQGSWEAGNSSSIERGRLLEWGSLRVAQFPGPRAARGGEGCSSCVHHGPKTPDHAASRKRGRPQRHRPGQPRKCWRSSSGHRSARAFPGDSSLSQQADGVPSTGGSGIFSEAVIRRLTRLRIQSIRRSAPEVPHWNTAPPAARFLRANVGGQSQRTFRIFLPVRNDR